MVRFLAILLGAVLFPAVTLADTASQELTPVGAERAGNAAGTIPAWDGGIADPIAGYTPGERLADPYADDPVLFTITAANQQEYADYLTEGQKAMLALYPDTWHMNVYASRRSAAYPDYVYDAIKGNASTSQLITEGRGGVENSTVTSPFPRPTQGVEVMWNHSLRFRGVHVNLR